MTCFCAFHIEMLLIELLRRLSAIFVMYPWGTKRSGIYVVVHTNKAVSGSSRCIDTGTMNESRVKVYDGPEWQFNGTVPKVTRNLWINNNLRIPSIGLSPTLTHDTHQVATRNDFNGPVLLRRRLDKRGPCLHSSCVRDRVKDLLMPAIGSAFILRWLNQTSIHKRIQRTLTETPEILNSGFDLSRSSKTHKRRRA